MKKFITLICILSLSNFGLVNAQTFTNYTTSQGLIDNNVSSVTVDSSDNIWFGTLNGACMFDGTNWTNHTNALDPGFVDDNVTCIAVTANQNIWIGTDYGVSVYNGSSWTTYTETDGLGDNRVRYIEEDNSGNIWFGEQDGLSKFDGSTWTTYNTSNGLPFGGISHIAVDANNTLWICTPFSGFYSFDGTTFTAYTESTGLLNDVTRAIAVDAQNNKYVGNSDGISVFNSTNTWVTNHEFMLPLPPPDSLNPVEDVKLDSQGNLWSGIYVDYLVTEGGVAWYNGASWTSYDVSDGLIGPVVRRLAIDSNDDVWVATSTGVTKISGTPTGITENSQNSKLAFYPNPATDLITLNIKTEQYKLNENLSIYDSRGKLQHIERINSNFQTIDCSFLSDGIYFLQYRSSYSKLVIN